MITRRISIRCQSSWVGILTRSVALSEEAVDAAIHTLESRVQEAETKGYPFKSLREARDGLVKKYAKGLTWRGGDNQLAEALREVWGQVFPNRYDAIQNRLGIPRNTDKVPFELSYRFYRELGRTKPSVVHLCRTYMALPKPRPTAVDAQSFEKFMKIVFGANLRELQHVRPHLEEIKREVEACGMGMTDKEMMVLIDSRYASGQFSQRTIDKVLKQIPVRGGAFVLLNRLALRSGRESLGVSMLKICRLVEEQGVPPNSALLGILLKSSTLAQNKAALYNALELVTDKSVLPLTGPSLGAIVEAFASYGQVDRALRVASLLKPTKPEPQAYALQEEIDWLYNQGDADSHVLYPLEAPPTMFDYFFPIPAHDIADYRRAYIQASGVLEFAKQHGFSLSTKCYERVFRMFGDSPETAECWSYAQLREVVRTLIETKPRLSEKMISSLVRAFQNTSGREEKLCADILAAFHSQKSSHHYRRAREEYILQKLASLFQLSYASV